MDTSRKKELINEYKNRTPEMGVISILCKATGDRFLGASNDINADFNSNRAKLSFGGHPNRQLLELWNRYGEGEFEFTALKTIKCEDPTKDYKADLKKLLERCLSDNQGARLIWR